MEPYKKELITLGLFFLLTQTIDTSYNNISTFIFQQHNHPSAGPRALIIRNLLFVLTATLTPAIRVPLKPQFIFGGFISLTVFSLAMLASYISNEMVSIAVRTTATGISGIGNAVLWVNQGRFVHLVC